MIRTELINVLLVIACCFISFQNDPLKQPSPFSFFQIKKIAFCFLFLKYIFNWSHFKTISHLQSYRDPNANFGGSSYNQGSTQYPHAQQYQSSASQYSSSSAFPQGQQFIASQGQYQPQPQPQGQYQSQSQPQGQYQPKPPQGQYSQQASPSQSSQPSGSQYQGSYSAPNANSVDYVGSYSEPGQSYAAKPNQQPQAQARSGNGEEQEESGPPRGFFYSFDYPVGIITQDQGKLLQKREDINGLYDKKKAALEQQLKQHGDYRVRRAVLFVWIDLKKKMLNILLAILFVPIYYLSICCK